VEVTMALQVGAVQPIALPQNHLLLHKLRTYQGEKIDVRN
jgi:hypothetical protein